MQEMLTGLLPGEIMIAEHDYAGAEKFFTDLAKSSSDPELLCAAKFARAFSKLRQNRAAEAANDFAEIETQNADLRRWAGRAHLARIYTLLKTGRQKEAEQDIDRQAEAEAVKLLESKGYKVSR